MAGVTIMWLLAAVVIVLIVVLYRYQKRSPHKPTPDPRLCPRCGVIHTAELRYGCPNCGYGAVD